MEDPRLRHGPEGLTEHLGPHRPVDVLVEHEVAVIERAHPVPRPQLAAHQSCREAEPRYLLLQVVLASVGLPQAALGALATRVDRHPHRIDHHAWVGQQDLGGEASRRGSAPRRLHQKADRVRLQPGVRVEEQDQLSVAAGHPQVGGGGVAEVGGLG